MFERVRAKDGRLVAKFNGKWVASSASPETEAEKWLTAQLHAPLLTNASSIIVLGAGCGYHLAAIQKKFTDKRIICIDACSEFIQFCDEHHGVNLARTQFIHASDIQGLMGNSKLIKVLQGSYGILEYQPATQFKKDIYEEFSAFLSGREWWAFREIIQKREDLRKNFSLTISSVLDVNELVSIKTMLKAVKENCDPEVETRLLLLRELVK